MSTEHRNTGESLGKKGESEIEKSETQQNKANEIQKCYEESCVAREALHEDIEGSFFPIIGTGLEQVLKHYTNDIFDTFPDSFEEFKKNLQGEYFLAEDGKCYFKPTYFEDLFPEEDFDLDIILVNHKDSPKVQESISSLINLLDVTESILNEVLSAITLEEYYFFFSELNTLKKEMNLEIKFPLSVKDRYTVIKKIRESERYDQYKVLLSKIITNAMQAFEEHQNRIKKVIESLPKEQEELDMWFKSGLNEIGKYEFLDNNLGISLKKETDKNHKVEVQNPHSYVWDGTENTWKEIPESQGLPLSAPIKKIEYIQYPPHSSGEAFAGVHLLLADGRSTTVVSLPPEGTSIPSSFTIVE